MIYSFKIWKRWSRERLRMSKTLTTTCFACAIIISTNVLVIQKFIKHLPTVVLAILEIVLILAILLTLIHAIILRRRDLLNAYMISAFVYSQYRIIIAVTAILIVIFPQTYLLALSSQRYSRSQVQVMWISVAIASIFAWTLQMASIYFAMTYRSYLPRFRRQTAISEAVSKKKQEESTMAPNMAQLQLEPVPEKELQPLPKEESQPVPTKNLQPVSRGEPQKPLPAKDQQLVPSPSTNEKAKVQVEEKH